MSDQVYYYQHGRQPIVLHIVSGDAQAKTVNLAREPKGPAIIEGIALSEDKGNGDGVAVLIKDAPKTEAKPKKKKAKKDTAGDGSKPPAGDGSKPPDGEGDDDEGEEEEEEEEIPSSSPPADGTTPPPPDE